jgi:hypothetical protein
MQILVSECLTPERGLRDGERELTIELLRVCCLTKKLGYRSETARIVK